MRRLSAKLVVVAALVAGLGASVATSAAAAPRPTSHLTHSTIRPADWTWN